MVLLRLLTILVLEENPVMLEEEHIMTVIRIMIENMIGYHFLIWMNILYETEK